MTEALFTGRLVRLTAEDPEPLGKAFSRWGRDSEYLRLLDTNPENLWSAKKFKDWMEKDLEKEQHSEFFFSIRTLEDDKLIGFTGMFGIQWSHGDTWVAIGLGEREYWGRGYGTDAMRIVLKYAFTELNLHRVTLGVFAYNTRAIHAYEKAGFIVEGRQRQLMQREGKRWDMVIMGILREEWGRGEWRVERGG